MNDPPRFTGTIRSPRRRSRAGLVGVSAALHQRRRGHRQRRRDPRQPARSRRQPSRPQHAADRCDPRVGAARRRPTTIAIRLFIWGPISGFLDRIWVGPDELLRPSYNLRTLIFVTLPVVFSSWQAILAVILGIMWVMRRHEPAYGVLAAAMAVGVAQAFLQTPMGENAVLPAQRDPDLFRTDRKRAGADIRAAVLGLEMAALRLDHLRSRRAAGAGRPVRKSGDGARAVPVSRRADGRHLAGHHGRCHGPFGAEAAECREPAARLRGHDHADLLDCRPARRCSR